MSQEKKRPAIRKAPRTQIEDLSPAIGELSEVEASRVSGGRIAQDCRVGTRCAGSCTLNNDTDYSSD
jgi:hypothetical protein